MPRLKDAMDSALGTAEPKEEKKAPPKRDLVKEHIARVLGRHQGLPTELVEGFYKCQSKMAVKRLLAGWLARQGAG